MRDANKVADVISVMTQGCTAEFSVFRKLHVFLMTFDLHGSSKLIV